MTPSAAEAVETIVSQPELPEGAGVRISAQAANSQNGTAPSTDLRLEVVTEPEPEDAVVDGAPIYVEQDTAPFLADKVLDAEISGQEIRFSLHEQDEGEAETGA